MNHSAISAPSYSQRRIGSVESLAAAMGLSAHELEGLANRADKLYRPAKTITKADGSIRYAYDALKPLKNIHSRIKTHILDRVIYPAYLTGSVKGRDYKVNASLHTHAKIVISEDISGFFPSTTEQRILDIWQNFFGFNSAVAHCLTKLTTKHGELPQGAITSSFLANLIFWKQEPELCARLAEKGWTYSRYVDDIAVSSKATIIANEKTEIIRHIYGMLYRYGYQPKRTKHDIATASKRMAVTKLSVNTKPGLAPQTRANLRAAVQEVEKIAADGKLLRTDSGIYAQAMGKVQMLRRFHPGKANSLIQRLSAVKKEVK